MKRKDRADALRIPSTADVKEEEVEYFSRVGISRRAFFVFRE